MREQDKDMIAGWIAARGKRPTKRRLEAAKRMVRWTLDEWTRHVDAALADGTIKNEEDPPAIMRIENTMFTSSRYFGAMTYNKRNYTYFEPEVDGHAPNEDGSPYVAWVMVRDDFIAQLLEGEVKEECKKEGDK